MGCFVDWRADEAKGTGMKKWGKVAGVVGQPLYAFGETGGKLVLVFDDSFVVICVDSPDYAECMSDSYACEEDPGDLLDIGEQSLIDLGIATPQEVASLVAVRDAERAKCEADRIQSGIAAEREQYERLRQKFGYT